MQARIKSLMLRIARNTLRRLLRWYMAVCTAFCTLAALFAVYSVFYEQYRCVQLPNGARLAPTQWFEKNIALKNSQGDIVVQPDIDGVVWNDQYVAGWRRISGEGYFPFLYKIGDPADMEYTGEERRAFVKQSGPTDHEEIMNYMYLIYHTDYHRAWCK